jgi:cytochrome c-type biogenesis protein CcmH/NrfG
MQDASGNNIGLDELRKAVVNDPRNADLRYLLGAEMAQQKDYEGAVMEMSAAIAFNPLLHLARFQ